MPGEVLRDLVQLAKLELDEWGRIAAAARQAGVLVAAVQRLMKELARMRDELPVPGTGNAS